MGSDATVILAHRCDLWPRADRPAWLLSADYG